MTIILLEPGNPDLFGAADNWPSIPAAEGLAIGPCIELVSVHQGMKQQVTTDVGNAARTSGRPVVTEFTCVKYVDNLSVKLYESCLRAQPLGKGPTQPTRLHFCRDSGHGNGGGPAIFMTIALRDALVSEIQLQTHPDDLPTEQFKLNFTEVLWTYAPQRTEGKAAAAQSAGWSVTQNRPIGGFTE